MFSDVLRNMQYTLIFICSRAPLGAKYSQVPWEDRGIVGSNTIVRCSEGPLRAKYSQVPLEDRGIVDSNNLFHATKTSQVPGEDRGGSELSGERGAGPNRGSRRRWLESVLILEQTFRARRTLPRQFCDMQCALIVTCSGAPLPSKYSHVQREGRGIVYTLIFICSSAPLGAKCSQVP